MNNIDKAQELIPQKKYMVFYKDNCGYPQKVMCTSNYWEAIAEMEWLNETDSDRREFGVIQIPA